MTIRMFLASRFRKLMFFGILAWVTFAGAGFAASSRWVPQSLPFIPFVGFAAVVLLVLLWIRCPRCDSPVGQSVGALNGKDRFCRRRVNFCAHCGVSFDEPYSSDSGTIVIKLAAMVDGIDSKSAPCEFVGALTDEFSAHPGESLAVVVEFAQSLYLDFVGPAQIVEF